MKIFQFPAPLLALVVTWRTVYGAFVLGSGSVTSALGQYLLAVVVLGTGIALVRGLVDHYRSTALITAVMPPPDPRLRRRKEDG